MRRKHPAPSSASAGGGRGPGDDFFPFELARGYGRRPVDWRRRLAERAVAEGRSLRRDEGDAAAGRIRRFLALNEDIKGAAAAHPDLAAAEQIRESDPVGRAVVEAWLLTGSPVETVAERTDTPVDVVTAYESMYFDVASRISAPSFVFQRVIRPYRRPATFAAAERVAWRVGAYNHGPVFLRWMLEAAALTRPERGTRDFAEWAAAKIRYGMFVGMTIGWGDETDREVQVVLRLYERLKRLERRRTRLAARV